MFCDKELVPNNTMVVQCFHENHMVFYYGVDYDYDYFSTAEICCNFTSLKWDGCKAILNHKDGWQFYRHGEFLFSIPYVQGQITPENAEQKIKMLLPFA